MHYSLDYEQAMNALWNADYVPAEPPSANLSPSNQARRVNNSPWQYTTSGYSSSASPPNTASSGSSPHSQAYVNSPDDLSVDSLITSLLKVVSIEDFGSITDLGLSQNNDNRCRDCTDLLLCDACNAKAMPINSLPLNEHFMPRPLTAEIPPTPVLHPHHHHHHNPSPMMPLYCEIHRDAQRFYCQTCSMPFCADCGRHLHVGHVTIHLIDAVETAGHQATQVMGEARIGMSALRDELDKIQIAAEALDQKAREASSDVMMSVRRAATALEAREKELLNQVEKARLLKFAALKAREESLRNGITRLTRAADKLTEVMDSSTMSSNPFDLFITKDMASSEIFQIRHARQNLKTPEENWIAFTGSEGSVIQAIANLGSIVANNPGPIGDRRTLRGRGNNAMSSPQRISPQFFHTNIPSPHASNPNIPNQLSPLIPIPRGRPIPATTYPVTVRTSRAGKLPIGINNHIKVVGNDADARDNLCRPWGIACDNEGQMIVADRSNNRIQIYRQDGSFVRRFGTHGSGPGQFDRPAGVAVDGRRRIIVADKDNHRVQVLTMEGLYLLSFGEKGCRCGQFNYPWDVTVNSECQIAVSDTRNHRVQLFSPEGIFLRKYGYETTPNMWKHFDSPRGVSFNPQGNVIVTDFNNHRVIMIEADFMSARVLIPECVNGVKQFLRPQGLIVDDDGNIIVADSRNHRIQIFDSTGSLKWKFGTHGKAVDEMDRPSGITLTPEGRIAVVDFGNNRVLII